MLIDDDHLYHGAALLQIAEHPQFTAINRLATTIGTARSTFRINDNIGVYMKYRSDPVGKFDEFVFNFTQDHLAEIEEVASKSNRTFIPLVCVDAQHICCLSVEDLRTLVTYRRRAKGEDEAVYSIVAQLPKGKQFRAYVNEPGKKGKIAGKEILVPRNAFPEILFA